MTETEAFECLRRAVAGEDVVVDARNQEQAEIAFFELVSVLERVSAFKAQRGYRRVVAARAAGCNCARGSVRVVNAA